MSVTVTTKQSWFGRLGGSIKGVLTGILLIIIAFPLLFWNEGSAVKTEKSLKEGAGQVIPIENDEILSENEGRLVHVSGELETNDTLEDDEFGISLNALKLKRTVEMYQWQEVSQSETKTKLGGGQETVTTYDYKKDWYETAIDSSDFREQAGHENPAGMSYESAELFATNVTLGAFTISGSLIKKAGEYTDYAVKASDLEPDARSTVTTTSIADEQVYEDMFGEEDWDAAAEAGASADRRTIQNGRIYIGSDPAKPAIGDQRISYQVAYPSTVSIVAKQSGSTFKPYQTKAGGTIEMLSAGSVDAEEMFASAQAGNTAKTWVLRFVGFLFFFLGFSAILKPLSVAGDVIPFIGSIIGFGAGIVAFVLALVLSLVTIAIAWLLYRPLIGITLLALAGGVFYLFKQKAGAKTAVPPVVPSPPAV